MENPYTVKQVLTDSNLLQAWYKVHYYLLFPKDMQEIIVDGPGSVTVDPDFILL